MRLTRTILGLAAAAFAASVAAIFISALAVLFFGDWFWDTFAQDVVIGWGATVLGALFVSSCLLLSHLRGRESYLTFEEIVLMLCLGLSAFPLLLFVLMALS